MLVEQITNPFPVHDLILDPRGGGRCEVLSGKGPVSKWSLGQYLLLKLIKLELESLT